MMLTTSLIVNDSVPINGKNDYNCYSSSNLYPFATSAFHTMRDTAERRINIPNVIDQAGNLIGVFDQSIILDTNYDQPFTIYIKQGYYVPGVGVKDSKEIFRKVIASGSNRIVFTPYDVTEHADAATIHQVFKLAELNQPIPLFVLSVKFDVTPTSGNTIMCITRRF